ncbi:hypothetical protein H4R99_005715, partial [Coemansia sp. RSA 1722]
MAVLSPARFSLKLALVALALCLCIALSTHGVLAADDAPKDAADKAQGGSKSTGDRDLTLNSNGVLGSTADSSSGGSNAISLSGSSDSPGSSSSN